MELKYIVYITVNLCNGKLYIGVHRTNPEVFDGYIGDGVYTQSNASDLNRPFHKAVKKYGYKNFQRTTIQCFPDTEEGKKQAYNLEKILVNSTFLKSKNVYNVALGGGGSISHDAKKVYMFDLKGNYLRSFKSVNDAALYLKTDNLYSAIKAIRNNCLGATASSFGYYWSYVKSFDYHNNRQKKVAQYTLSGKFLRYFDSLSEAETAFQVPDLIQAIKNQSSSAGYQWRYYDGTDDDIPTLINVSTKNKILPIIMIDKSGNETYYNSVNECKEYNPDFSVSQINRVLKGIIKTHKGYYFKYQDEDIVQATMKVVENNE